MKLAQPSLFVFLFLLFTPSTFSQKRFNAGLLIGSNFAQLDGDDLQGYKKPGWHIGLRGTARLQKRVDLSMELLFNQKGSQSEGWRSFGRAVLNPFKIKLTYAEAPILLNVKFWEKKKFYKWNAHAGASYARLISSSVEERIISNDQTIYSEIEPMFRKNDVTLLFGLTYFFRKNVGLTLRHSLSMMPIFIPEEGSKYDKIQIRSYFLTLRAVVMIR